MSTATRKYEGQSKPEPEMPDEVLPFNEADFADWLIKYHGAHESSRSTIISNIEREYRRCRMQGMLTQATEHPQVVVHFSLFGKSKKAIEGAGK